MKEKPIKNRDSKFATKSIYNIIYEYVIPKWKKYLKSKSERRISTQIKPRKDTLWRKILRDVREFYRILFRVRFHFLDYKDISSKTACTKILFEELGIPLTDEEFSDHNLFMFIHQTHKTSQNVINKSQHSPFEAIEKYSTFYKELFMTNLTCARMFYYVYQNFLNEYCTQVNPRYRKTVVSMIWMLLNCYNRMSSCHHLKRILIIKAINVILP